MEKLCKQQFFTCFLGPPELFSTPDRYIQVKQDTAVIIEISVNGVIPDDEFIWLFNGEPIRSNNHYDVSNCRINSLLTIERIMPNNSGNYTVLVRNSAGNISVHFQVSVISKLYSNNTTVCISLTIDRYPNNIIKTDSGLYLCQIENEEL